MSSKRVILIIFLLALIPRFIVAVSSVQVPTHDDTGYDDTAYSLQKDGVFGLNNKPASFKPPVYFFFLAFVYRIFGHSYAAIRIIQAFLGAFTCVIIFLIALNLTNKGIATIAGLLGAGNISFIMSTQFLLTEAFATFLLSLIVLLLVRLRQAQSLGRGILTGFLSGLLALTRSEMLFFLPFIYGIWLYLDYCERQHPLRIFFKEALAVFAALFTVVSLWTYRNWRVHHEFVPVTTSVGINLYSSYCPQQGKLFGTTSRDDTVMASRKIDSEVGRSRFLTRETFKYIRNNLNKLPRLELLKLFFFWSVLDWEIVGNGVYNFSFGFMLPFFIIGFLLNSGKWKKYFLLYGCIVFFQILALVLYGSPRFRIPCEPLIIIFAAMGIAYFYEKFSKKAIPLITLSAFLMFNIALYFNSAPLKIFLKGIFIKTGLW